MQFLLFLIVSPALRLTIANPLSEYEDFSYFQNSDDLPPLPDDSNLWSVFSDEPSSNDVPISSGALNWADFELAGSENLCGATNEEIQMFGKMKTRDVADLCRTSPVLAWPDVNNINNLPGVNNPEDENVKNSAPAAAAAPSSVEQQCQEPYPQHLCCGKPYIDMAPNRLGIYSRMESCTFGRWRTTLLSLIHSQDLSANNKHIQPPSYMNYVVESMRCVAPCMMYVKKEFFLGPATNNNSAQRADWYFLSCY